MTSSNSTDSGLASLVTLLRFHGIPADADQLRHRAAGHAFGIAEIVRGAREHRLKVKVRSTHFRHLPRQALPAIVRLRDGRFMLLAKIVEQTVLLHDPIIGQPTLMEAADFASAWDGTLIMMARRAALSDLTRRFDISWFLQAMYKYRGMLGEVLIASLFIQIFALITPLFFQVVIDKVLVHRGLTTLDLLVVGLLIIGGFESLLTGLRTYLFAHTTNRIDVELGARLFKHLLALPIGYFEARRAGGSVARVRELENIRNFLTSSPWYLPGYSLPCDHTRQAEVLSEAALQGTRPHREDDGKAETLQAHRPTLRENRQELPLYRRLRSRPHLAQIRPHGLIQEEVHSQLSLMGNLSQLSN